MTPELPVPVKNWPMTKLGKVKFVSVQVVKRRFIALTLNAFTFELELKL